METQNKQTQKQRSPFAYSKLLFIEYTSWDSKRGQHFMSAVLKDKDKKQHVIARFHLAKDENGKAIYTVKDPDGNEILVGNNLIKLKQDVKAIAREMSKAPAIQPEQDIPVIPQEKSSPEKQQQTTSDREEELGSIREKTYSRSHDKSINR
ncbi:MAG: hypothetical protein HY841_08845 [Bacteroidetes bacterium]|nr:hypothetical protein [Bacteroidota bacterium]